MFAGCRAAELLRRLVGAVESGQLDASSPHGVRLLRRIEGAILTLEALTSSATGGKSARKGMDAESG
jgi:hypothetical protein